MEQPKDSLDWDGPRHECGVAALYAMKGRIPDMETDVAPLLSRMLLDMQMRGELSAGMALYNPNRKRLLEIHRDLGTVSQAFRLGSSQKSAVVFNRCTGPVGIAHTRYATSGREDINAAQPFERYHGRAHKWFSFAWNGNLANYKHLRYLLEVKQGYHTLHGTDTETIMHFLSRELRGTRKPRPARIFYNLSVEFDGCYNIVFLNADGDLIVARDPMGFRPLCWAQDEKLFGVASESVALWNLGFNEIFDIKPGWLIHVSPNGVAHRQFSNFHLYKRCFFEWVYFSNVASTFDGRSVYVVRNALGRSLAELEPIQPDENTVIVPVPDSAKAAADAMGHHLRVPVIEGLMRNRYVGRSFIKGENRSEVVQQKYTPVRGALVGKKIILVDDSIVRGNTMRNIISDLKNRGQAKEIHLRITCPPITRPCFYGIDMSTLKELFATSFLNEPPEDAVPDSMLKEMAEDLGADSLLYLPLSKIPECVGFPRDELCMACVDGVYPTPAGLKMCQLAEENLKNGITARTTEC
ncbi:MAG: amidophosphoribosyltransferase [Planctomycetes bacterium]|nr:amidophosphoribosyltransferase [Planctomycetota bacterium]